MDQKTKLTQEGVPTSFAVLESLVAFATAAGARCSSSRRVPAAQPGPRSLENGEDPLRPKWPTRQARRRSKPSVSHEQAPLASAAGSTARQPESEGAAAAGNLPARPLGKLRLFIASHLFLLQGYSGQALWRVKHPV
eukprot:5983866-Amphidinium_carterae.1